jgi:hypothetical protein
MSSRLHACYNQLLDFALIAENDRLFAESKAVTLAAALAISDFAVRGYWRGQCSGRH